MSLLYDPIRFKRNWRRILPLKRIRGFQIRLNGCQTEVIAVAEDGAVSVTPALRVEELFDRFKGSFVEAVDGIGFFFVIAVRLRIRVDEEDRIVRVQRSVPRRLRRQRRGGFG